MYNRRLPKILRRVGRNIIIMKQIVLLFLTLISTNVYAQKFKLTEVDSIMAEVGVYGWEFFWPNNETLDRAYEAPNSALIKGWYSRIGISKDDDDDSEYIQFYANGTFKFCFYNDYAGYIAEITGRWKRSKLDITLTYNANSIKVSPSGDWNYSDYSLRKQEEMKNWLRERRAYIKKLWSKCSVSRGKLQILDARLVWKDDHPIINRLDNRFVSEEYLTAKYASHLNSQTYKYAHKGEYDDAISAIDEAIKLQPREANWYDSKGEMLYMKGDVAGAKAMWDKVISIDPNFTENNTLLYYLVTHKGWNFVNSDFSKYVPFKKIRVKIDPKVSESASANFSKYPSKNGSSDYKVDFYMNLISGNNDSDKRKINECTNVGDGWFEYEFSNYVYFSDYSGNVPDGSLQILIE